MASLNDRYTGAALKGLRVALWQSCGVCFPRGSQLQVSFGTCKFKLHQKYCDYEKLALIFGCCSALRKLDRLTHYGPDYSRQTSRLLCLACC